VNDLDRSIIATLSYYGAMSWPLTAMEVHERLIPAARLGGGRGRPSAAEVFMRLGVLCGRGDIAGRDGMYSLTGTPENTWASRVDREKETAQKWRRLRRAAWWLQAVPYVRALLASGSLASGMAGPESDWDVFTVAHAGRLYTARTFLLAAAFCMGRLRTKHHAIAPDRFCFNHYVTTDGLPLRHRGIFLAHALALLVPIHDPDGYLTRLRQANGWTAEFITSGGPGTFVRREVPRSRVLGGIRRILEILLNTPAGAFAERALRTWQQQRIAREPATHARGGRIVADDRELEFHPHSFERTVLDRYNRSVARIGPAGYAERDSGLAR